MINYKKLVGGGAEDVEKLVDEASVIGVDLIELMWTPRNGLPRESVARVVGFKVPVKTGNDIITSEHANASWIDGEAKFYPDPNGRCWGYVYDTEANRKLIMTSLSSGRFRIVDSKIRGEIIAEAEKLEIPTEVSHVTEVSVKKSKREVEAERRIKNAEEKLRDYKAKMNKLENALADAEGKKKVYHEKRLKGVKIDPDKLKTDDSEETDE